MISKIWAGMVLVLISLGPSVREQTAPPNSQQGVRYLVLDEKKIPSVRQKLAEAAGNGFHIVAVAPKMKDGFASGLTIILEGNAEGMPAREYTLLDNQSIGLTGRVDEAAAKGYRVVTHGGFEHQRHDYGRDFSGSLIPAIIEQMIYGHDLSHASTIDHSKYDVHTTYMLMERSDSRSAAPCEYFLIAPRETAFLEHMGQGKNRIVAAEGSLWVIESCATGFGTDATAPEPLTIRSLPLSEKLEKDQNQLSIAAADGFHVSYAAGRHLTLEKGTSPAVLREYQIVSNNSASSLQKLLNSTGEFRLISGSLWVKLNFWGMEKLSAVLEKTSDSTIAYRYKVLRSSTSKDMQKDLNQPPNQGYRVRDLVRDDMGITAVLETTR
jgi:hypothetical protein